jgi:uncharacterized membrane protein YccF (DUF307 family)
MRTILNILWLVLAGFWLAIGYAIAGVINCIFIVTIPFGIASFRLAGYALWPFGRSVVPKGIKAGALSTLGNVLWFVFGGLWMALLHMVAGIFLCVTIIGIPLGIASFKMAGLALAPLGKTIVPNSEVAAHYAKLGASAAPPPVSLNLVKSPDTP